MNRTQLYAFVSSLLDNYQIDATLFDTFLDIAQMAVEGIRPWRVLLSEDVTQTWGAGDTFLTQKSIPALFMNYESESPIIATDSQNNPTYLFEVPFSEKNRYRNTMGKFYCDYANNHLYVCGAATQSYTLHQFFIKESPLLSAKTGASYDDLLWIFPSRFSKILGLYIAVYWKLGPDYDIISNTQANQFASMANTMNSIMETWDSKIQNSQARGIDPFDRDVNTGFPDGQRVGA